MRCRPVSNVFHFQSCFLPRICRPIIWGNVQTPFWTACDNTSLTQKCKYRNTLPSKMWILPLVGYMGMGLGFGFLTLAIGMSQTLRFYLKAYQISKQPLDSIISLNWSKSTLCLPKSCLRASYTSLSAYKFCCASSMASLSSSLFSA